jgi:hypothetical protein
MDDQEDHNHVRQEEGEEVGNQNETTFGFHPPSTPTFYGKINEYPNTFLFEFDILCRSYNYLQDAKKLKLFLATLKDSALRWFMGLGESNIRYWEGMKDYFLRNTKTTTSIRILVMIFSKSNS